MGLTARAGSLYNYAGENTASSSSSLPSNTPKKSTLGNSPCISKPQGNVVCDIPPGSDAEQSGKDNGGVNYTSGRNCQDNGFSSSANGFSSSANGFHDSHCKLFIKQGLQHERQAELFDRKGLATTKIQHIAKNGLKVYPPEIPSGSFEADPARDRTSIWVTRTSRLEAVANQEELNDEEWAERVSLSDTSEHHYQEARHSPRVGLAPARTGQAKANDTNVRSRRTMSRPGRRGCCKLIHLKEDNARFILLAVVIVVYMLSGAALFAALERDNELQEKKMYKQHIENFKSKYPLVNETDLQTLLDIHSKAESAGFVGNKRPRWDFSGAFYFVGTVVSTIGKL